MLSFNTGASVFDGTAESPASKAFDIEEHRVMKFPYFQTTYTRHFFPSSASDSHSAKPTLAVTRNLCQFTLDLQHIAPNFMRKMHMDTMSWQYSYTKPLQVADRCF